ncbi:hypothetical protein COU58_01490 [Candidatus Pacearchaeota archaeon CG10_big_fil_rev_8_21_14_0_10_32_42]|nr:MAG: hypothetical protein COU58_01490 [Candidatus Pacearchaeota archaeon CG10_big_fil_rev_8_21_14_0_10_32_42]
METNNYLDALRSRKLRDVKIATFDRKDLMKKQDGKCFKCKKDLRAGYYKFSRDLKTKENHAICSDCLVTIPERRG